MKISAAFPSKFLRAADLPDGQFAPVRISHVELEVVGSDGDDARPVIYFEGKAKGLVCNKTNATTIAARYGDDTEGWTGKTILLYATETIFNARSVACIRVKIPAENAVPQRARTADQAPSLGSVPTGGKRLPERLPEPVSPISDERLVDEADIIF